MNALKKLVADFRDDPLAWRKLCWELADMAVQPIDFHERYSNNRFQDLCKALTYLNHCEASAVVYPVGDLEK